MTIRMKPAERKAAILTAAMAATTKHGFSHVRQKHIADEAECSYGTVSLYFNTMAQMRRAIMREAIRSNLLPIIAQGFGISDPDAKKACAASTELKQKVLAALSK